MRIIKREKARIQISLTRGVESGEPLLYIYRGAGGGIEQANTLVSSIRKSKRVD